MMWDFSSHQTMRACCDVRIQIWDGCQHFSGFLFLTVLLATQLGIAGCVLLPCPEKCDWRSKMFCTADCLAFPSVWAGGLKEQSGAEVQEVNAQWEKSHPTYAHVLLGGLLIIQYQFQPICHLQLQLLLTLLSCLETAPNQLVCKLGSLTTATATTSKHQL